MNGGQISSITLHPPTPPTPSLPPVLHRHLMTISEAFVSTSTFQRWQPALNPLSLNHGADTEGGFSSALVRSAGWGELRALPPRCRS